MPIEVVDISEQDLSPDAGVFNVTVDSGSRFVTVLVYYDLATDTCRLHTAQLSSAVVNAIRNDPDLKAEMREAVKFERDRLEDNAKHLEALAEMAKKRWN